MQQRCMWLSEPELLTVCLLYRESWPTPSLEHMPILNSLRRNPCHIFRCLGCYSRDEYFLFLILLMHIFILTKFLRNGLTFFIVLMKIFLML